MTEPGPAAGRESPALPPGRSNRPTRWSQWSDLRAFTEKVAAKPVDQVLWSDLTTGDRVHHFEYGTGTIDSAGPVWLCIT